MTRNETLTSGFLLAHYLFPVALGLSFSLVMHRATGLPLSAAGMVLFTAGIGCAYSLDRLIDKPTTPYPRWVFLALVATFATAALAGLVAAVCLPVKTLSATLIFAAASLLSPPQAISDSQDHPSCGCLDMGRSRFANRQQSLGSVGLVVYQRLLSTHPFDVGGLYSL